MEEDAAWVERILQARAAGNSAPFGEIVERFAPRIFSVLRGMLGSETDAEDVSQEVFSKVYRSLERYRGNSSLFTWIYRVAINAAHDWNKRSRRHRAVSLTLLPERYGGDGADGFEIPAAGLSTSDPDALGASERIDAVRRALEELPPPYRTILVLRELEGLSYEEIAESLDLKKGTVESRLFRARQMLRQVAERRHLEELL